MKSLRSRRACPERSRRDPYPHRVRKSASGNSHRPLPDARRHPLDLSHPRSRLPVETGLAPSPPQSPTQPAKRRSHDSYQGMPSGIPPGIREGSRLQPLSAAEILIPPILGRARVARPIAKRRAGMSVGRTLLSAALALAVASDLPAPEKSKPNNNLKGSGQSLP